jgi:hypothetical protein
MTSNLFVLLRSHGGEEKNKNKEDEKFGKGASIDSRGMEVLLVEAVQAAE